MPLNFSGQSLIGRSFIGTDLSGADFSFTDIRSADFTGANLADANFHRSRAGLSGRWQLLQVVTLLFCSATIGTMSVMTGIFVVAFLTPENISLFTPLPGLLCAIIFASLSLPLLFQGFTSRTFQSLIVACIAAIIAISISSLAATAIGAVESSGGVLGSVVLLITNAIVLTVAGLTQGRRLIFGCLVCSVLGALLSYPYIYPLAIEAIAITSPSVATRSVSELDSSSSTYLINQIGMSLVVLEIFLGGAFVATRVMAKDAIFDLIQKVATNFTTLGGTQFAQARLHRANFAEARLHCTNFSSAQLTRTHFYLSSQLNTARLSDTILSNARVRTLAASHNGYRKSYRALNLTGINLTHAGLAEADFSESNLSNATLVGADLTGANLTKVQAIATSFQKARLTACCVEAWNIDSTTQLDNADCLHVYLKSQQQERRPSSGDFSPGEFTKLFQEMVDTIDLIFQGGIDWQALHTMLKKANAQRSASEIERGHLTLRSIENKDDGVVVVRIDAPPHEEKARLHSSLNEHYQNALLALEAQYQRQLEAKDEQIATYREQQANLNAIAQVITSQFANPSAYKLSHPSSKLVCLKLSGTQVTLQIGDEGRRPFLDHTGSLPNSAPLLKQYQPWQTSYRSHLRLLADISPPSCHHRLSTPPHYVTNVSIDQTQQALWQITQQMHHRFNQWLDADTFRPLREKLLENLNPSDTIRVVLQADDPQLWQLPWHSWDLLSRYPNAEITLSTQHYQHRQLQKISIQPSIEQSGNAKILAVMGQDDHLDLQTDCRLLASLPSAQITILQQPTRQELNNRLWEQPWDVLFFAGHSTSATNPTDQGYLQLNDADSLSLNDIRYALQKACSQGLQLAIFNSCDGLGLVHTLSELPLSQMIVMREAIPDQVAQTFLHHLLKSFASGQPLPQAVREAREKLQGIEDRFPCASWLPVLCQTAATEPLTWQALCGNLLGQ